MQGGQMSYSKHIATDEWQNPCLVCNKKEAERLLDECLAVFRRRNDIQIHEMIFLAFIVDELTSTKREAW